MNWAASLAAPGIAGRIEKIVPTETLTSMLDEPSSGSIATSSGASAFRRLASASSSDTRMATGAASSASMNSLSVRRSSAFCTSPPAFCDPACGSPAGAASAASGPSAIWPATLAAAPATARITSATGARLASAATADTRKASSPFDSAIPLRSSMYRPDRSPLGQRRCHPHVIPCRKAPRKGKTSLEIETSLGIKSSPKMKSVEASPKKN